MSLRSLSARIGRWPRRLAALACLMLAAGSAVSSRSRANGLHPAPGRGLPAGSVAMPVPITSAGNDYILAGDRVSLLTAPADAVGLGPPPSALSTVVADRLRVLRAPTTHDDGTAVLVVAVPRAQVTRVAGRLDRALIAVVDPP